jgi:hypothetical protein
VKKKAAAVGKKEKETGWLDDLDQKQQIQLAWTGLEKDCLVWGADSPLFSLDFLV